MFLRNAVRRSIRTKSLWLVPIIALAMSAMAAAAQATTCTGSCIYVDIGSPNNTINLFNEAGKAGNYHLWGLGGVVYLAGGTGNNELVGNGSCPPSLYNTTGFDNGTQEWDAYCNTGAQQSYKTTAGVLLGGGGVNTIFGTGGANAISSGTDDPGTPKSPNASSPFGNYIYGGPFADGILALVGSSAIYPGTGTNIIDARGADPDYIDCHVGDKGTTVYAETYDTVVNCAHVYHSNPLVAPSATTPPVVKGTTRSVWSSAHIHVSRKHATKKHSRSKSK
ncbi:MAG: hypothetical protein ACLP50_26825 [Solirubrobacteraceae bacterium]